MDAVRIVIYLIVLGLPLVLGLVWWWWADWRLRRLPSGWGRTAWRGAMVVCTLVFSACFLWLIVSRWRGVPWVPHPWVMAYMMLWGLIFLPFMALPWMGAWLMWQGGRWCVGRVLRWGEQGEASSCGAADVQGDEGAVNPSDRMTRRQMLAATAVTLPMLTTLGSTVYSIPQKRRFKITEYTLRLPDLPADLDGMRIAHLSDTHVGKFTRGAILDRIADATNDLAADLVLLTGDVIDHSVVDLPDALRMLDRIDPRAGLFVCEGNHDLFDGRAAFREPMWSHGVNLLVDESRTVRIRSTPVQIMGVAWHGRGEAIAPHVDAAAGYREEGAFPILLAHHPDAFDRAAELGIPLTLAGHTHGGQLMLSDGFGAGPLMFKYWSGVYEQGDAKLVVSNGTGNWFPLRTNAPAEIIHLTLKRGK